MSLIRRLDQFVARLCRWAVVSCLSGLFILLTMGMLQRLFPAVPLTGYDELVELLFGWMTFAGALALWREGSLYRVNALDRFLPPLFKRVWWALIHLGMLAVALVLAWMGWRFMRESGEVTPFLGWDKAWWYAAMPVCGALMSIYSLVAALRTLWGHTTLHDTMEGL